jgi:hypothetical protein
VLCGVSNVGTLVLLCAQEVVSKIIGSNLLKYEIQIYFLPTLFQWYHSLTRGWCSPRAT